MRRIIIAGNWKMHTDKIEAEDLSRSIVNKVNEHENLLVVLCPPFPLLSPVQEIIEDTSVALGAQNVHYEETGAFTGEVSDNMLLSVGCSFVIIGHSERRTIFGESDEFINQKVQRVLTGPLCPILCVGESLKEREEGKTFERIKQQIEDDLKDIELENGHGLVIAYEPVWAIGTGKTATPEQAEEVHAFIRKLLADKFGDDIAADITIQYGGSVKPENADELLSKLDIDGALVGGASLKADDFASIIASGAKHAG